jgi:drug/metabolite transporter (DMT)-like permease
MFDNYTAIKFALGLLAAIAWALQIVFAARRRRSQPDWSFPVDTWSMEKIGIWWVGRGLMVLVIFVAGIGFALGGTGSSSGASVLFCFSAVATVLEFIRSKI